MRAAEGTPESVLMINTDITEKKRMEEHFLRAQRMERGSARWPAASHTI